MAPTKRTTMIAVDIVIIVFVVVVILKSKCAVQYM